MSGGIRPATAAHEIRKRKWDAAPNTGPPSKRARVEGNEAKPHNPLEELLRPTISFTQYPRGVNPRPFTLQPLMLLRREDVPLSYLDLADAHGEFPATRRVESYIKPLDLEGRRGSKPVSLIAMSKPTRKLYILERCEGHQYALCKLGTWVDVASLAKVSVAYLCDAVKALTSTFQDASRPAIPCHTSLQDYLEGKQKKRAIQELQALTKKPSRGPLSGDEDLKKTHPATAPASDSQDQEATKAQGRSTPILEGWQPGPTAREDTACATFPQTRADSDETPTTTTLALLENIRSHYAETLYHSMGSIAYFVKGPLSRARAAFSLNPCSDRQAEDLIEFLRVLVMTTIQIDRKYRERVPGIISATTAALETTDDEDSKRKRRRCKKLKLSKDGLFRDEEDHIRRWWRTIQRARECRSSEVGSISTEEVRFHVDNLRTRETLLQMAIILEILGLEQAQANSSGSLKSLSYEKSRGLPLEPAVKKRNKQNLHALLDFHADRLCIWQSTETECYFAGDSQLSDPDAGNGQLGVDGSDLLRDFCVDIIIPFFSSRLQEQCDVISRKLGGPPTAAPPPSASRKTTTSTKPLPGKSGVKPGSITKRPVLNSCQSADKLEKALCKDRAWRSISRGPGVADPLAALRAATLPVVPRLKREGSSNTSSSKDLPEAFQSAAGSRNATQIHTPGITMFEDPKARKKAILEAELRDAISAIKKPNREILGRAVAEELEMRTLSQRPKSRKPTRHPQGLAQVQVKATPANSRFRDVFAEERRPGLGSIKNGAFDEDGGGGSTTPSAAKISSTPMKVYPASVSPAWGRGGMPSAFPLSGKRRSPKQKQVASFTKDVTFKDPPCSNEVLASDTSMVTAQPAHQMPLEHGNGRQPGLPGGAQSQRMSIATAANTAPGATVEDGKPQVPTDTERRGASGMSIFQKLGWD